MIADYPRDNFSITRMTQGTIPRVPFVLAKNTVLGKKYNLSLVFTPKDQAISMHKQWKKKSDPANILSFPLDTQTGEIFINLGQVRKEAREYDRTYHEHLLFLFIHGMLHLRGFKHGGKMEKEEEKFFKKLLKEL